MFEPEDETKLQRHTQDVYEYNRKCYYTIEKRVFIFG